MSILANRPNLGHVYMPNTALAKSVEFTEDSMQIFQTDGRTLSVPLLWIPSLMARGDWCSA